MAASRSQFSTTLVGAITRLGRLLEDADLLVAVAEPGGAWPDLPRPADLRVATKRDLGRREDARISVSAQTGEGLESLQEAIVEALVPAADRQHPHPWRFDPRLPG